MINICLCDDRIEFTKLLEDEVKKITAKYDVKIKSYNDSLELKKDLSSIKFDIYILDICMPNISGIELAKYINSICKDHLIIFFTSNSEYVFKSFQLNIFRYIKKENYQEELLEALNSAIQKIETKHHKYTFKTKNGIVSVAANDILYFTINNRNIEIHYSDKSDILVGLTISKLKEYLNNNVFFIIDRSTIVNLNNYLKFNISENKMIMSNNDILYISRYRKKDLIRRIKSLEKVV